MIKFEKIIPGMTLYDVRPSKLRLMHGTNRKWSVWPVHVIEVNTERRRVLASWNMNPATWIFERQVCKYRLKRPENPPL